MPKTLLPHLGNILVSLVIAIVLFSLTFNLNYGTNNRGVPLPNIIITYTSGIASYDWNFWGTVANFVFDFLLIYILESKLAQKLK